jgi:sirohydrochlorin ferrochelatase
VTGRTGAARATGATRLVTVAHGTRHRDGNRVAAEITRQAAARLGVAAQGAYVELCHPLVSEVLSAGGPAVVVPLLLSTGYHVRHDLPSALAGPGQVLAGPLGPDPLLAAAQVTRLVEAGAAPGQPVVLAAAGSRDPGATADLEAAAGLLAVAWGGPVRSATLAGRGSRLEDVVLPGDAVSPYLLAPGHFAERAEALARDAGAGVVAAPIGAHRLVVDLVMRRALPLLRESARASA